VCPICYQRNQFPQNYADISESNLPLELFPQYTTIEYALPTRQTLPPVFLFVVDTCLPEDELHALKSNILLSLTLIPENSLVGLITFGAMVQLHELAFVGCPKSYVFRGNKEVTAKQIQDLLALSNSRTSANVKPGGGQQTAFRENGFLVPLSECELTLTSTLEELQHDPRPVKNDKRPLRATGVAISAAISLLEVITTTPPTLLHPKNITSCTHYAKSSYCYHHYIFLLLFLPLFISCTTHNLNTAL
jgi:protein transport protein SEC23